MLAREKLNLPESNDPRLKFCVEIALRSLAIDGARTLSVSPLGIADHTRGIIPRVAVAYRAAGLIRAAVLQIEVTGPQKPPRRGYYRRRVSRTTAVHFTAEAMNPLLAAAEVLHIILLKPTSGLLCLFITELARPAVFLRRLRGGPGFEIRS